MKKRIPAAALITVLAASLAGCGSASSGSDDGDSSTIKIALIPPTTGALAQFGTDAVKGWQLAADEVNAEGGIDGHKVELLAKGTDGEPATTLRVAKEAVTKDGAGFIGAVFTSPENAALNAQLEGMGALSLNALGKDDALVGEQCAANAFHVVQTSSMDINALAGSIDSTPGEKWAIIAVDYATGHSAAKEFTSAVKASGKQVVSTQFAPLNTTDFGSYITKIKSSGADAVFAVEYGADGVAFVKQADQFGLTKSLETVVGFNMVSEPLFPALGPSIVGFYNNVGYDVAGDNPQNTAFVAGYTEKYDSAPYYVPADNYLAAQTLFAGIDEAGSIDPEKVREALEDITFDSIVGSVTMRAEDHQLLRQSYLGQVVQGDSGAAFKIVATADPDETTAEANPACSL